MSHDAASPLTLRIVAGAIAALLPASAMLPGEITVYRCTDASGAVSLQDTPCAATQQQERRALRAPDDPPATPIVPQPTSPTAASRIEHDADSVVQLPARRAPSPLFVCERHDGTQYESTDGVPERRWVPLWALGADPRAPADALDPSTIGRTSPLRRTARDGVPALQVSAATLGTWVEDTCIALSPAQICARRRSALDGYGRRIFNAVQSEADRLRNEERALRKQLREECGTG